MCASTAICINTTVPIPLQKGCNNLSLIVLCGLTFTLVIVLIYSQGAAPDCCLHLRTERQLSLLGVCGWGARECSIAWSEVEIWGTASGLADYGGDSHL